MKEKLEAYCNFELESVKKYGADVNKALDRCYGAVMFFINFMKDEYDEEVGAWWDDEMLPKFKNLQTKNN